MAINVGDAVLTFIGDTTNLDQAFDRVNNTSKSKLQPIASTIQDIGGEWQFTGKAASTAGSLSDFAGEQMEQAGKKSTAAFREATATIGLLGEATGVTLPRHVRTFIAGFSGLSEVLATAFSATAVFFLIEAIVKGTEKLSEWVSETFIFTEAMKAVDEVSSETNKKIAEQVDQLGKLKDAYALIGLQGSALTIGQFSKLSETADQASSKLRDFQNEIFGLRNGLVTLPEATDVANQHIRELFKDLPEADLKKKLLPDDAEFDQVITVLGDFAGKAKAETDTTNQDLAGIQKSYDAQVLAEQIATQEARITATRQAGDAQINLELQLALLRNAQLKTAYGADEAAQIEYNNRKYQSELSAFIAQRALADQRVANDRKNLEIQKSLIAANDPESAAKQAAIDAEIEAIERQHAASIIAIDGQIVAAKKQHAAQVVADYREATTELEAENKKFVAIQVASVRSLLDAVSADVPVEDTFNPWMEALDAITKAYQTLGVTGVVPLEGQLRDERKALDDLFAGYQSGIVSKDDYLRASLKEIDTEIALARALGNSTKELERQRAAIRSLIPEQKKHGDVAVQVSQQIGQAILQEAFAFGQSAVTIGQALRNITASIIQEIAKQAEVRGAAKLAEALGEVFHNPAAAAGDFASAAAWFALAGGISAAAGAIEGSGRGDQGSDGVPGNLPPTQQTAATTAQDNQLQTINIQRFAVGGMVSSPMLGVVGHGREEIIPIDDERATSPLADAIALRIGAGGGEIHNHYHIKGDVIDYNHLMKKQTRAAKRGQGRLTATDSLRRTGR